MRVLKAKSECLPVKVSFILTFMIFKIFFKFIFFHSVSFIMVIVHVFANVFRLYPVQYFAVFILFSDNEKIWEVGSHE